MKKLLDTLGIWLVTRVEVEPRRARQAKPSKEAQIERDVFGGSDPTATPPCGRVESLAPECPAEKPVEHAA